MSSNGVKNILKKSIREILKEEIPFSTLKDVCKAQYKKYEKNNMYITPLMENLDKQQEIGIPISIKDNFMTKNIKTTAASKMLMDFIAPYNATIVDRLDKYNFINFGKCNMDEFAMGSSGVSSYFGPTKSIWSNKKGEVFSPGGSSAGSAVSVASGAVFASICTDTSGSIIIPASWCGVVGFKPTYGVLSRNGIIPLAESFDHPGLITRLVDDCRYIFEKIIGKDPQDLTTIDYQPSYSHKKKFAIIKEIYEADATINKKIQEVEEVFMQLGYEKKTYSVQELEAAIAIYVILCRAECASNLQRYDGLRFGFSSYSNNLEDQYVNTRSEGFGLEVQRRIMTGGFVTSSENVVEYLEKAQKIRQIIKEKISEIFQEVDFVLMPAAMGAMTIEECLNVNLQDPIKMQKCDQFSVVGNICGFPSLTVPIGEDLSGSPFGVAVMGNAFQDLQIMDLGEVIERNFPMQEKLINKITEEK